jgi:hypothetical protein
MYKGSQERNSMTVCRLKGVRRNSEWGISPICSKEEEWSHILRCEGTKIWRDKILDKRFKHINAETGNRG